MDMRPEDRDIVTTAMIRGFNDCAKECGTSVTGGQTVQNPWPIIGACVFCMWHILCLIQTHHEMSA